MKNRIFKNVLALVSVIILAGCVGCSSDDNNNSTNNPDSDTTTVLSVDTSLFLTSTSAVTITTVPCTLSDGTETDCYQIVSTSSPSDHEMGHGVQTILQMMHRQVEFG